MSNPGNVAQASASIQASLASLNIANAQPQVAAKLVEAAVQQVGPTEQGKGQHIDQHA